MKRLNPQAVVDFVAGHPGCTTPDIVAAFGRPRSTITQILARLMNAGRIVRENSGPATSYRVPAPAAEVPAKTAPSSPITWSNQARALQASIDRPIGLRTPVTYRRDFLDSYQPNVTTLLPARIATELHERGRLPGQLPAGTYARRVLEPLLIDLSWYSSRLEGNQKSLLDTRELFQRGRSPGEDADATMLLNHKDAIEFLVDATPEYGITDAVVSNLQALLMNGILEAKELGAIREKVVDIAGSVYVPSQVPLLLKELLVLIVEKARFIKNPIESAFFLWVNIAYLQPFADGNKRTSRLAANLPLLISNCAPLSFIDVTQVDYANAMLGVYEECNVALAAELFEWTYRRSVDRYQVIVAATSAPDPLRTRYREQIGEAVRQVIQARQPLARALAELGLPTEDADYVATAVRADLDALEIFNCARVRLPMRTVERWIADGRPIS